METERPWFSERVEASSISRSSTSSELAQSEKESGEVEHGLTVVAARYNNNNNNQETHTLTGPLLFNFFLLRTYCLFFRRSSASPPKLFFVFPPVFRAFSIWSVALNLLFLDQTRPVVRLPISVLCDTWSAPWRKWLLRKCWSARFLGRVLRLLLRIDLKSRMRASSGLWPVLESTEKGRYLKAQNRKASWFWSLFLITAGIKRERNFSHCRSISSKVFTNCMSTGLSTELEGKTSSEQNWFLC